MRPRITDKKWWSWALAGWLNWLEHHPIHQKVVGLIPSQGTYLGCRFNGWGAYRRQPIDVSFTLMFFLFLSPFLSL